MAQTFINRHGQTIKVNDLQKAIEFAENAIEFHEGKAERGDDIQFPEALKDWRHDLKKLKEMKSPKNSRRRSVGQN